MSTNDSQAYKCKEKGCDESVQYEPKIVLAFITPGAPHQSKKKTKVVYLTCANGHTHSYVVPNP